MIYDIAVQASKVQGEPLILDAHHHLWDPGSGKYPWMVGAYAELRHRSGPEELKPLLSQAGVGATVVVEAREEVQESIALLEAAHANPFIKGVVGWVDLTDAGVGETIAWLQALPTGRLLVGVRSRIHDEPDPFWLLRADVQRGLAEVARAGLAYDLLVRPRELPAVLEVLQSFPESRFVIDHVAKPLVARGEDSHWAALLLQVSQFENVFCKLSGLVTEADWAGWKPSQLDPFISRALEWFGPARLMIGSDWPVCTLAGEYAEVLTAYRAPLEQLSRSEQSDVLRDTATRFYRLTVN